MAECAAGGEQEPEEIGRNLGKASGEAVLGESGEAEENGVEKGGVEGMDVGGMAEAGGGDG